MTTRWIFGIPPYAFLAFAALLVACGSDGPAGGGQNQARIERFEASPASIENSGYVEISWQTRNAVSLELHRDGEQIDLGTASIEQGSVDVWVAETSSFQLLASGASGGPASETIWVMVTGGPAPAPSIGGFTGPEEVGRDELGKAVAALNWSAVYNADEVVLESDTMDTIAIPVSELPTGGLEVELDSDTTFTLVATSPFGEARLEHEVKVVELPVIDSLTADRSWVGLGDPVVVSWATTGAVHVELFVDEQQVELVDHTATTGSHEIALHFDSEIELRAYNAVGQMVSEQIEAQVGLPVVERFEVSAFGIWTGETLELEWETQGGRSLQVVVEGTNQLVCETDVAATVDKSGCTWQPADGSYVLVLAVENGSGITTSSKIVTVGPGPRIESFSVTPAEITVGDTVRIAWSTSADPLGNLPSLQLADDRGGTYEVTGASGSKNITFDSGVGAFEFTLLATTDHPSSVDVQAKASLFVHPFPAVTLTATPELFDDADADDVEIAWTSEGATSLILSQTTSTGSRVIEDIPEERRAAGSYRFVPEEASTFRIDARNAAGVLVFAEAAVTLAPPQVLRFESDVNQFDVGDPVQLSWDTRIATNVDISILGSSHVAGENKEPYIDAAGEGGTHLPLLSSCDAAILTQGCAGLTFPSGFHFPFSGQSFSSVRVYGNGFLSFASSFGTSISNQNQSFPSSAAYQHVHLAPFWDALTWDESYPEGNIYYLLRTHPTRGRALIIQWKDATFFAQTDRGASLNFEVVLFESGDFDFRYGDMDAGLNPTQFQLDAVEARGATIGYQLTDRSASHMHGYNRSTTVWGSLYGRSFAYSPAPKVERSGSYTWYASPTGPSMEITATASRGGVSDVETLSFTTHRRPELIFAQRPDAPVEVDTEFRIGWKTTFATKIEIRDQAGTQRCEKTLAQEVAEGFCALTESTPGAYTYSVIVSDARNKQIEKLVRAVIHEPFSIESFTLDREYVEVGQDVTVTWVTHNADRISLKANGVELFAETPPASGSLALPVTADTTFVLRVENSLGVFREERLDVELWNVRLVLTPSATEVRAGQPVTIGVEATALDGGAAPRVYGTFPMTEVLPSPEYRDLSGFPDATHQIITNVVSGSIDVAFPASFSFPYFGEVFRELRLSVEGYVSFHSGSWAYPSNRPLPEESDVPPGLETPVGLISLAPFWDDLTLWPGAMVWTAMLDADTFGIQWTSASSATGSDAANPYDLNFQIILSRSGAFEYRYGRMASPRVESAACRPSSCFNEANGSSATIAYQAPDGKRGLTIHHGGRDSHPGNPIFPGGLTNRTLRYEPYLSGNQVVVNPVVPSTYHFCVQSGQDHLCRAVEIDVDFGIDTFSADAELINLGTSTTLRWKTRGGSTLRILNGEEVVWSTTDLSEIDEGSRVVNPTSNASYVLELSGPGVRTIESIFVDVVRAQVTTTAPATAAPGSTITLSWNVSSADPTFDPIVLAPMEEVTGLPFSARDISSLPGVATVHAGGVTTAMKSVDFPDGFTFNYLGTPQTSVRVSALGFLSFDPSVSNANATNTMLPNAAAAPSRVHLAPFWDTLATRTNGRVYAARWDDDTFVVQWSRISVSTGSTNADEYNLNFMVVMHRDGTFEYRYGAMDPVAAGHTSCRPNTCWSEANGSIATIGFQDVSNTYGYVLNFSNTAAQEKFVPGGLANRTWRFSPGGISGSRQLVPWETSSYLVCALDRATLDQTCADPVEVIARWGLSSFSVDELNPVPGTPVTLSWDVMGLDRLRVLGDGVAIFDEASGSFQDQGSLLHLPSGPTHYILEGHSLGRVTRAELTVHPRTFNLSMTPSSTQILPGDEVTITWSFTPIEGSSSVGFSTPLTEVGASGSQFQSIRGVGTELTMTGSVSSGYAEIVLPFSFPYFGQWPNRAVVYVDGYLSFDPTGVNGQGTNTVLPNAGTNQARIHLAPFWDDLMNGETSSLWTHSPNAQTFIIQWTDMDRTGGNGNDYDLNFQVVLFDDGSFEYRYGTMAPPPGFNYSGCYPSTCLLEANGSSATIGYQSTDSKVGYVHHVGGNNAATVVPLEGGLENKSLRFQPATSGTTTVKVGSQAKDFSLCGFVGGYSTCQVLRLEPVASPGDLTITELMIAPAGGASEQWFEVRNLSERPIDLDGFRISSNSGSHTITGPLVVNPFGYALFAATTIPGATVDRAWGTDLSLGTSIDTLALNAGNAAIASVTWGGAWTVPAGQTLTLDGTFQWAGAASNDDATRWCVGGSGSPGTFGGGCSNDRYDIDPAASGTFHDIEGTGTRLYALDHWGGVAAVRVGGFDWPFFGRRYSDLWIASNGWISFSAERPGGETSGSPSAMLGAPFPRQSFHSPKGPLIGGFWDTLRCVKDLFGCSVTYERGTFDGEEALIVQWTNFQRGNASTVNPGRITFQIQLWASGDIAVVFGEVHSDAAPGSTAWNDYRGNQSWVGLESHDLEDFLTAHYRKVSHFENRTIRFYAK